MTESTMGQAQPRERVISRMVMFVAIAALLVGFSSGVVLDRYVWHGRPGHFGGLGRERGRESPEERAAMQRRMADRMAKELDLTPEQRQQVEAILPKQMAAFDSLRREMAPRLKALLDSSFAAVEAILTPEQRAKWAENRRRFGPGREPPMP